MLDALWRRLRDWLLRRLSGSDGAGGDDGGGVDVPTADGSATLPPEFRESSPERITAAAQLETARSRRLDLVARVARLGLDGAPASWDRFEPRTDADVCVYLPGRLLVAADAVEAARDTLGVDSRACELRGGRLTLVSWEDPERDPLEVATVLSEKGVEAAPDHLVLLTPGYVFGPGADPEPAPTQPDEGYRPSGRIGVTVLDTGLYDTSAPPPGGSLATPAPAWLAARSVPPEHRDVLDLDGDRYLDHAAGHGTFIADIVASMAPCADLHVERVGHPDGLIAESDLADAIDRWRDRLSGRRPELLNLSLGVYACPGLPIALQDQVAQLERAAEARGLDVLVVAAAGNDDVDRPFYPAAFAPQSDLVVSVGALDDDDPTARADYSNHGEWVRLWAPGTAKAFYPPGVFRYGDGSTEAWFKDAAARWAGTSFATPYVVGLLAAQRCDGDPGRSLRESRDELLDGERMPEVDGGGTRVALWRTKQWS